MKIIEEKKKKNKQTSDPLLTSPRDITKMPAVDVCHTTVTFTVLPQFAIAFKYTPYHLGVQSL